jgi:hypothetical protein
LSGFPFLLIFTIIAYLTKSKFKLLKVNILTIGFVGLISSILFIYIYYYLKYPGLISGSLENISIQNSYRIRHDIDLFPYADKFPYNGSVYGPLLPQIISFISFINLDIVFLSKLIIAYFLLCTFLVFIFHKDKFNKELLLLLIMFYATLTSVRPDVIILFALTIILIYGHNRKSFLIIPFILLALIVLKINAILFGIYALIIIRRFSNLKLFITVFSSLIFTCLYFLLFQISIKGWVLTNLSATKHGLNFKNLILGLIVYLIILIIGLSREFQTKKFLTSFGKINVLLMISIHLVSILIASKNGAGPHHLAPVILIDSYLIKEFSLISNLDSKFIIILAPVLMFFLVSFRSNLNVILSDMNDSLMKRSEIQHFDSKYTNLFMGQSGENSKDIIYVSYFKNGNPIQVDYSTFGDLNIVGLNDLRFASEISSCNLKLILLPKGNGAFDLKSPYNSNVSLFPHVRSEFTKNYFLVESGKFFDLYGCEQ